MSQHQSTPRADRRKSVPLRKVVGLVRELAKHTQPTKSDRQVAAAMLDRPPAHTLVTLLRREARREVNDQLSRTVRTQPREFTGRKAPLPTRGWGAWVETLDVQARDRVRTSKTRRPQVVTRVVRRTRGGQSLVAFDGTPERPSATFVDLRRDKLDDATDAAHERMLEDPDACEIEWDELDDVIATRLLAELLGIKRTDAEMLRCFDIDGARTRNAWQVAKITGWPVASVRMIMRRLGAAGVLEEERRIPSGYGRRTDTIVWNTSPVVAVDLSVLKRRLADARAAEEAARTAGSRERALVDRIAFDVFEKGLSIRAAAKEHGVDRRRIDRLFAAHPEVVAGHKRSAARWAAIAEQNRAKGGARPARISTPSLTHVDPNKRSATLGKEGGGIRAAAAPPQGAAPEVPAARPRASGLAPASATERELRLLGLASDEVPATLAALESHQLRGQMASAVPAAITTALADDATLDRLGLDVERMDAAELEDAMAGAVFDGEVDRPTYDRIVEAHRLRRSRAALIMGVA